MRDTQANILLVMADQLATSVLRAYGNPVAQTPHLDALASEGVVFERAYCTSPLCAPSRASLLSGLLPSRLGTFDNGAEFAASFPTLAHRLRAAGYFTCLAGKMHFVGPDQLHGFEQRITTDVYPAGMDWIPDWTRPVDERLPWYHDMTSVLGAGVYAATLQLDYDEEVAFRAERKLYDLARADDPRPFFFVVSFTHPHDPYEIPKRYWDLHANVDRPRVGAIPLEEADAHSRRVRAMCGTDAAELTEEDVLNARRAYAGATSYVDEKLGRLLSALDASGIRERTIVLFCSDHGDMLGERGLWYKMTFFEDSARVPFVVHAPDRFPPGRVQENVSLVDLVPTLVELARPGEPPPAPDPLDGKSLLPLLTGDASSRDDAVVSEYLAEGTHAPCVMVRRGAFKYVHCPDDPDLLYDLESDPSELVNVAPDRPDLVAEFADEVKRRWDLAMLREHVLASQRRRLLVARALAEGARAAWDYL
ncbi:MAG: choline-sulfatase, partial [Actinomycetota bacterium]|nr:choline-sulfatase [Actinomycetota bacterium]